uniref:C2H2-type domain-containing protein n=1 Tax=Lotharella oceanica TaxID=641309 RepID=A0A7S2X7V3_9EUKA|mmetsp:Transcript_17774/g.33684  ORF Transcript_17774/g.33684 Transcript_17774/m.33684 type:complete len:107 (+) Transcript_17774:194-514(+)
MRPRRRKHSKRKRKEYMCPLCERNFSQKCNLDSHVRTHTGERPYACSMCNVSFKQKSNLNRHRRRVHGLPTQKRPAKRQGTVDGSNEREHLLPSPSSAAARGQRTP